MQKKTNKPDYSHLVIHFKHDTLRTDDMEIMNDPLVAIIAESDEARLIASLADDGVGDLIVVPFTEIEELGRDEQGNLFIRTNTTEGLETWPLYDFRVIHY